MECKYNQEEFCTNDQCPMCGDYCPVPDYEGVCKYEDRQEVWLLTPKGCLIAALDKHDLHIADEYLNSVWNDFVDLMGKFGYRRDM